MTDSPPEDITLDYDVVIVGAGLAGLTAANELHDRCPELRILVVEAKDRVGGRLLTVPIKVRHNKTEHVDLGGQWVGKTQLEVLQLLKDLGIETYNQYTDGQKMGQFGVAKPRKYQTTLPLSSIRQFSLTEMMDFIVNIAKIEGLARKLILGDVFKYKNSTHLDDSSVSKWTKENAWTRAFVDVHDVAVRAIYAVDPSRMNMLFHLTYCKSAGSLMDLCEAVGDGAQALKIVGGAQQLCVKLADKLPKDTLVMGEAVRSLDIDEAAGTTSICLESVADYKTTRNLTCSRVILAIPPVQINKIAITPHFPHMKHRLYENMIIGHFIKFVVTYETAFWRESGFSGEIISTGKTEIPGEVSFSWRRLLIDYLPLQKLPIIVTYDATTVDGAPAIVGFINEEFSDMTVEQRCNEVTKDLVRFLGERALNEFIDYKDKVWMHEPYNGGCPTSIVTPGNMDTWQYIREPHHTIHFAGTETALKWMGYMDGAIESGYRTAHEVLHCLEKHTAVSFTRLEGSVFDNDYRPPLPPSDNYSSLRSPWWRRAFFCSALVFGIYAYSKKYQLSYTARVMKPVENTLVRWTTGIVWPE